MRISARPLGAPECGDGSQAEVETLAKVLVRKTDGNPLYRTQLLNDLNNDGLVRVDAEQKRWTWDIDAIERESRATTSWTSCSSGCTASTVRRAMLRSRWSCSKQ